MTTVTQAESELGSLKSAIETMSEGFALFDADDCLVLCNVRYRDMYGYSETDARPGIHISELLHKDIKLNRIAKVGGLETIQRRLDTFGKTEKAFDLPLADGCWVQTRDRKTADGGTVCIHTDITRHIRAEEALHDSEELFRGAFETSTAGMTLFDNDGNYFKVNQTFCELLGYNEDELLQMNWRDVSDPNYLRSTDPASEKMKTGELENFATEKLYIHKGGHEVWTQLFCAHLRNAEGTLKSIFSQIYDITDRKRAEQELTQSKELLEKTEARLIDSIESISDAFIHYDADERLIYSNEKNKDFFPAIADHLVPGARLEDVIRVAATDGVDFEEAEDIEEYVQKRLSDFRKYRENREQHLKDGRWVLCSEYQTRDGGVVGVRTEITEQKKAEEILRGAKEQAEAATEAKSAFVAMVSHEVRTPMNGVLGMARLLLETSLQPEQREYAKNVVSSGEALLVILNDLLDISKLENGKLEIEAVPFAPNQIVADTVSVMTSSARDKGLELNCDIASDLPNVLVGDINRIRQILFNLLNNAIKFTSRGSVRVTASGAVGKDGKSAFELSVSDTGMGLTKKDATKLFAPYVQASADVARKYGGTGLGLSICRQLARLMGGDVHLKSKRGKGSTFTLSLDLDIGNETDVLVTLPDADSSQELPFSPHVLLADDNEMNRKVALGMMRKFAATTAVAENGQQVLDLISAQGPFDIVLMDRHMPILDGIEATRKIRALAGPVSETPIIGLTAAATRDEIEECLKVGMNDVVTKPIDPGQLKEAIRRQIAVIDDGDRRDHVEPISETNEETKIFDRSALEQLGVDHGVEAIGDFIAMFRQIAPAAMEKFTKASADDNLPVMALHVHELKNSATIVGLTRLTLLSREIELACKDAQKNNARALSADLQAVLIEADAALSGWLKQNSAKPINKRSQTLSAATHDLRDIMNRMLGSVVEIEDGIASQLVESQLENHTAAMLRETKNMTDLIGGMADNIVDTDSPAVVELEANAEPKAGSGDRVLLVEDDVLLARSLVTYLNKHDFEAITVETGAEMFKQIDNREFDGFVIDLTLPDEDGIVLIRKLRARTDVPIIVQTGREDLDDKLAAFELGADEYITKPIDPRELSVRLKSILKRAAESRGASSDILCVGDYTLDQNRHHATAPDGKTIQFTSAEFALIWTLARAGGEILSRETLVDAVATGDGPESLRAIDSLTKRVRKKLGKDAIVSEYGAGFKCGWPVSTLD